MVCLLVLFLSNIKQLMNDFKNDLKNKYFIFTLLNLHSVVMQSKLYESKVFHSHNTKTFEFLSIYTL